MPFSLYFLVVQAELEDYCVDSNRQQRSTWSCAEGPSLLAHPALPLCLILSQSFCILNKNSDNHNTAQDRNDMEAPKNPGAHSHHHKMKKMDQKI
jgi:hypothetical protein